MARKKKRVAKFVLVVPQYATGLTRTQIRTLKRAFKNKVVEVLAGSEKTASANVVMIADVTLNSGVRPPGGD